MSDDVVFVLPVIDVEKAQRCVATMHEDVRVRTCVIDNSEHGFECEVGRLVRPPRNLGVARSWNYAITHYPAQAYAFLTAQLRFGSPGGRDLLALAFAAQSDVHLPPPTYWHSAVFPRSVFERVGTFDENFYPAYYEDVDMLRRCRIAGIAFDEHGSINAKTSGDGHGVDALRHQHPGLPTINYDALAAYWKAKWRVHVTRAAHIDEGVRNPFADPANDLAFWPSRTIDELAHEHGITVAPERVERCPDRL